MQKITTGPGKGSFRERDMFRFRIRIFFFTIALLLIPVSGMARIGSWTPTIVDYEAEMEVYGNYRIYDTRRDDVYWNEKSLFVKEYFNLGINGFVYHPRLLQYRLGLSVRLEQSKFENSARSYSRSGWANGLNLRATILPMHSYNLQLFYLRYEPMSGSGASTGPATVSYSKGAIFKYKKKPYFFNASYVNNTRESSTSISDWTSYLANATYFRQYKDSRALSISAGLRRIEFSSSSSPYKSIGNSATLSGSHSRKKMNISAGLSFYNSEYGGSSSNSFAATAAAGLDLPMNFNAGLGISFSKSDTHNVFAGGSDTSSKTNSGSFSISHKLYRSLSTGLGVSYSKSDSTNGSVRSLSGSLSASYVKNVPGGILRSGIGLGRRSSKSDAVTPTIDMPFRQTVPRAINEPLFLLDDINVDKASITIFMLDPDVPEHRERLEEGTHYIVTPFGNAYEIEIIKVPPEFPDFATYDFVVSYKTAIKAEYQTDTLNYRLSLDLLDRFYPYYRHYSSKQRIISGSVQGGDNETVTDTAGLHIILTPFRFTAAYTRVESEIVPSNTWSFEANYEKDLAPTARLNARVQYSKSFYPKGTSGLGIAYSEKKTGGVLGITKRFQKQGVSLHASGSYWQRTGLSDADSYSLSSSVSWKVQKFVLEFGASNNFVKSESATSTTERNFQNYYIHLRRKLI